MDVANQYTQRDVPGMLDIRGSADPAAKVTVNRQPTQRFLDYFYKGLAVANGSTAQFPEIKVTAVKNHVGPNDEDLQSETIVSVLKFSPYPHGAVAVVSRHVSTKFTPEPGG